jgi:hypothetical protein
MFRMVSTIPCKMLNGDIGQELAESLVWYADNYMYIIESVYQFIEDGSNVIHQSGPFMNGWFTVAEISVFQLCCKY